MPMPNLYNTVPIIDLTDVERDPICMVLKRKCDEYVTEQINYNCSVYFVYDKTNGILRIEYTAGNIEQLDDNFVLRTFAIFKKYFEDTFALTCYNVVCERFMNDSTEYRVKAKCKLSQETYDTLKVLFKMEGYDLEEIAHPFRDVSSMFQSCTNLKSVDFSSLLKHKK